jgi:uncharacterized protein YegP (UPF0339 family)
MWEFQVYQDTGGSWRWRLVADNGKITASSGESFYSKQSAVDAAERVKLKAGSARVVVVS